jgi:hypothetical protein
MKTHLIKLLLFLPKNEIFQKLIVFLTNDKKLLFNYSLIVY